MRTPWLKTFLHFPNGIPSHDTLGRVFAMLNPQALTEAFRQWMSAVASETSGSVVALDGKTLRRSFRRRGLGFVHMVSAWSVQNQVVLAQIKTEEKSNEITAIPRLLDGSPHESVGGRKRYDDEFDRCLSGWRWPY